jgi:protein-L-isoaspartate(D-aspartate) O-methyltransferase
VGSGSGYAAAVLSQLGTEVYGIELERELHDRSVVTIRELGYSSVHLRHGDGFLGWPEKAPFDAIIGTAAAGEIPSPLIEQLKPGGRMILPVEGEHGLQHLILLTKDQQGQLRRERVLSVRFVPMTGVNTRSAGPGAGP